jgi:hypothetical protein
MAAITTNKQKSILVQIMNEVDELTPEEKNFVLYWLKTKKNASAATKANTTVKPNTITSDDIYAERNAMRKEKS